MILPRVGLLFTLPVLLLGMAVASPPPQQAKSDPQGEAFFERKVRPLLVEQCYSCHSAQSKPLMGSLRLDTRAAVLKGGAQGAAIVPGQPDRSLLVKAIHYTNSAPKMPPKGKLTDSQIATLTDWIKRGAPWGKDEGARIKDKSPSSTWWAFQPLRSVTPPKIQNPKSKIQNPIDLFIQAKLAAKGMRPNPSADRRALIRRATFDLIGLPPTPREVDAFLADKSPNAWEKVIDRLLASQRYGERWGRHWLDVVHYGDTHGYDKDKRRNHAWPYRDYVIRAFNEDKPYARFVQEQVAGDVLFPDNPEGVIATGFIAAGPWDFVGNVELAEGTVEKEKTRLLDRDDMVANTMSTFNSVTIHCARCHDHKFDPIPQRDYYRLQAVFSGVERGDRPPDGNVTPTSPSNGYHSAIEAKPDVMKWLQIDLGKSLPLEEIRLLPARPTDFADTPGFGFPLRFQITAADTPDFANALLLADYTASDYTNPGDHAVVIKAAGHTARYIRVTALRLWKRTNDYVFALAEMQALSGGKNVARGATVTALDSIEAGRWSVKFLTDDFDSRRSTLAPASKPSGRTVPGSPDLVYAVLPRKPRPIHVLLRGDVEQPREAATPGTLSCLAGLNADLPAKPDDEGSGRAALARWLTSPQNPLTWRSIVNRVWAYHFGRGLVDTPNDFGRNGSLPSHPELLDWLAERFMSREKGVPLLSTLDSRLSTRFACGQSLKRLHRLIMTSDAYCRSAADSPVNTRQDSDNRLLWRMNRRRLEAEEVRDSVLVVSGKLNFKMGGPGFELFRFKDDHSPIYDHSAPEKINDPAGWRRAIYAFTVRSVPNPFMECLDGADPNLNTPVRSTTLTALQALTLLNDPFMMQQAEFLAARVQASSIDPQKQVEGAFRLLFARRPTASERTAFTTYAQRYGLPNACRVLLNANEFVFID